MNTDTIVAQATAKGIGGVSVIRLSGPGSLKTALSFFTVNRPAPDETPGKPAAQNMVSKSPPNTEGGRGSNGACGWLAPRYMYYGGIDTKNLKEQCLFVYFKEPQSFTGEDVVEIQCHGGYYISGQIINLCIQNGARLAEPGEFSRRAFINGKMSLDEAEGIVDLINAESEAEMKAGFNLMQGKLFNTVKQMQTKLTDTLAEIEVNLDYPENDIEYKTKDKIKDTLQGVLGELKELNVTESTGRLIKQGVSVVIVGRPNVGKSSLLNAMVSFNRAIVADTPGTTRDFIEETYVFGGIKFKLFDTAGLRESSDSVEKIGIGKAKELVNSADIVLVLLDAGRLTNLDLQNLKLVKDTNYLIVVNKIDREENIDYTKLGQFIKMKARPGRKGDKLNVIKISALQNINIDELKQSIYDLTVNKKIAESDLVLTNKRHTESVKHAMELLEQCIKNMKKLSLDLIAADVKEVWNTLGEITGETATEEIIDAIFSKFCLGK